MKTPLDHEPFPPVELSQDQKQQLQWLSNAVVDETLAEYDEFVYTHNRHIDKNKWKQAMARENVTIYKRHGKGELGGYTPQVSLAPGGVHKPPHSTYWRIPKVIGVGSIPGTVEELLYGILAPSQSDKEVRSTYIKDDVVDTRVLSSILTPTETQPFQSLVLRWTLVCQLIHKICVSPRDMVHIEASGYKTLANGDKIGYVLIHPVEVPGCGSLEHLGAIRCGLSSCFVFRDADNQGGSVELYMRGFVTPGGNMPDGVATLIASMTLISSHRFMTCGQHKKIAWMIRNQYAQKMKKMRQAAASTESEYEYDQNEGSSSGRRSSSGTLYSHNHEEQGKRRSCPVCTRSLGGLRSSVACDVCGTKVCAHCVDKRKLTHVSVSGRLVRVQTKVCRTCATVSATIPASVVALSEHVQLTSSSGSWHKNVMANGSISSTNCSTDEYYYHQDLHGAGASFSSLDSNMAWCDGDGDDSTRRSSAITITTAVLEEADQDTSSTTATSQPQQDEQLALWLRMNKLRVAAEETYMLAKYNAIAMLEAQQQTQKTQQATRRPPLTQKTQMP